MAIPNNHSLRCYGTMTIRISRHSYTYDTTIIDLHHHIFFFLILILVFVSWMLILILWHFHYQKNPIPARIVHGTTIDFIRTIFLSIIPMFIAIPPFTALCSMDEVVVDPAITIEAIGHHGIRVRPFTRVTKVQRNVLVVHEASGLLVTSRSSL
ncbi:hypothetical protein AMTRI_Chr02g215280 [Amborella trichopoda]